MTTTRSPRSGRLAPAAVLAAAALGLTACAGAADDAAQSSGTAGPAAPITAPADGASPDAESVAVSSASAEGQTAALTVSDPWTKATEEGMTGSFGLLENSSDQDLHVVSVTADAGAEAELHEMAAGDDGQMLMRQAPDGFVVPAGGSLELSPGGSHVMLMGLTDPIEPGEEVAYELELEDGSTVAVTSVARPFAGANESYHGGEGEETDAHADH